MFSHSAFRILYSVILALALGSACWAQSASGSADLINNARDYDAKTVIYSGEAIGDIMARGAYAWININDGANAIGVWIKKELAGGISYTGSYQARGDWVEVKGEFQRSCREHGGDLDIHAQTLNIISSGAEALHGINKKFL
jgi:hypothetical protein